MISNYNLSCDYHNFELKDKIYLIPDWALKVIYTDGFNEVVFSGNSANVTILEGYDISFQEETSFDERFKFSKTLSIKVEGYITFNDLDYRYYAIIETKEGEFYLVNVDFPSFVTHTYSLANGTNSTELVFSSQSNIATLKLTNFNPNNVNSCKQYSNAKIKNVKLTEAWASYLSTWQKTLVNKGEFVDIEPLPDSISLTEEFDGEKYTVTLGFDIPMSYYKNDWHIKLLQFEENKYRGYITLEDGYKAFVGYNVGLFPSYTINGDIISIRLTETAIRGIAYGNEYGIVDTDMPNTISFNGASCYTYNWNSSCDWNVESKPDYITITPTSGQADTQYELTICNTDDETGYAVSEFTIKTCNARVKHQVVVENPIYRWVSTEETMCVLDSMTRTTSGTPYCTGYDKYVDVTTEISYDSGETWQFVSSASTLIEHTSEDCGYVPSVDYLTFVAEEAGTFSFTPRNSNVISYSTDNGATWITGNSVNVNNGDVVKWKGEMTPSTDYLNYGIGTFSSTGNFEAEGNVMSLHFGDDFSGQTSLSGMNHAFSTLFSDCNGLTSAKNLILPATTLAIYCYYGMFSGCTSLTTAPVVLSATTLVDSCYCFMFQDCTSLTTAPELPATTLAQSCYYRMFRGCTSLTTAPNLSATTLAIQCYNDMFYGCTSLTTAPVLSATTLAISCYANMFSGCTSLNSITCLARDISAIQCTQSWLNGVASSGTFVKAANMTSWTTGVNGIPSGWNVVDYTG